MRCCWEEGRQNRRCPERGRRKLTASLRRNIKARLGKGHASEDSKNQADKQKAAAAAGNSALSVTTSFVPPGRRLNGLADQVQKFLCGI